MRCDREGVALAGVLAVAAITTTVLSVTTIPMAGVIATICWVATGFTLWFFRDPERHPASTDGVISAADGVVLAVEEVTAQGFQDGRALRIAVFMNVFNVHVNRSPIAGIVLRTEHRPGMKRAVYHPRAEYDNEYGDTDLETVEGLVRVRQIAGLVARRVVTRVKPGDRLERGQRIGLIRFGSRVDVFLPLTAVALVRRGDRVRAGETTIARFDGSDGMATGGAV